MIALPVWQPWATLLVMGAKRVETRSRPPWSRMVGPQIAIYATCTGLTKRAMRDTLRKPPFAEALDGVDLPTGAIVGTIVLDRASEMSAEQVEWMTDNRPIEHAFGFYEPGRWAWVMRDPVPFLQPIETRPPKGRRGPFDWRAHELG